jgi:hypothetical protein
MLCSRAALEQLDHLVRRDGQTSVLLVLPVLLERDRQLLDALISGFSVSPSSINRHLLAIDQETTGRQIARTVNPQAPPIR